MAASVLLAVGLLWYGESWAAVHTACVLYDGTLEDYERHRARLHDLFPQLTFTFDHIPVAPPPPEVLDQPPAEPAEPAAPAAPPSHKR